MLDILYGFRIVVDHSMADKVQYRFPRSKKKRIHKKWAKKLENWKMVPCDKVYQMGDMLIMHPATAERLRKEVKCQDQQRTSGLMLSQGLFH